MLDIKFLRENPDVVKENIKKKFRCQGKEGTAGGGRPPCVPEKDIQRDWRPDGTGKKR